MFEEAYNGFIMLHKVPWVQGDTNASFLGLIFREILVQLCNVIIIDDFFVQELELSFLEADDDSILLSPIGLMQLVPKTFKLWSIKVLQVIHFLSRMVNMRFSFE
jgi:hypothetical protein